LTRSHAVNSSTGGNHNIGGPFDDAHPCLQISKITAPSTTLAVVESTAAYDDFNPLMPAAYAQPTRTGYRMGHLFICYSVNTNELYVDGHAGQRQATLLLPTNSPNPWTIDGSPFSAADNAKAATTIDYALEQAKAGN
jgi:hypothetical protein